MNVLDVGLWITEKSVLASLADLTVGARYILH